MQEKIKIVSDKLGKKRDKSYETWIKKYLLEEIIKIITHKADKGSLNKDGGDGLAMLISNSIFFSSN